MRILTAAALAFAAALTTPASAQTVPTDRLINVTFSGTVTNGPAQTIQLRQPDGSFAPYTGPLPAYPYNTGDAVTVSFTTRVPTSSFYDLYPNLKSADGIYRIGVVGPNNNPSATFGLASNLDVSGPITPTANLGQTLGTNGLTIVYNANTDSYSLELPSNNWVASLFDAPSFFYNAATNQLTSAPSSCYLGSGSGCNTQGIGGFAIRSSDLTSINTSAIPIWQPAPVNNQQPAQVGSFSLGFTGGWNLPTFGNPVDVPEPSSLLLFGLGAGIVAARRRRSTAKA
jgi:hypothetical protein